MSCESSRRPLEKTAQIINHVLDSKYIAKRNVDIWLPPDYNQKESYPVLYMHDGQMLFDSTTTWNKQEWSVDEVLLMLSDSIHMPIVVGVWNADPDRHAEYFPEKVYLSLSAEERITLDQIDREPGKRLFSRMPYSDDYLRFLVEELKPFVDSTYNTLQDRENTVVAGSSMGGLISMYAAYEYPNVFGRAICMSTHWPGTFSLEKNPIPAAFLQYLDSKVDLTKDLKLYYDRGDQTLDALYASPQNKVDSLYQAHGYLANQIQSMIFPGDAHDERSWASRLHIPFYMMFKK